MLQVITAISGQRCWLNIADRFCKAWSLRISRWSGISDKILSRGKQFKDQMEMFTDFTGMEKPDASGFLKTGGFCNA